MDTIQIVLDYANGQGMPYRIIEPVGEWNGYSVFHGYFNNVGELNYGGAPLYLLEKNGKVRFSTYEEGFQILDCLTGKST